MEALSRPEMAELLEEAPVAHFAVLYQDEPYVTPMSYVRLGETFYFRTAPGRRMDAIRSNPAVCLEVCRYEPDSGHWWTVVVTGEASIVTDPAVEAEVSQALLHKYASTIGSPLSHGGLVPLATPFHVVAVHAREVTGLSSGAGLAPGLRPGRL